jgi:hypothetical protein
MRIGNPPITDAPMCWCTPVFFTATFGISQGVETIKAALSIPLTIVLTLPISSRVTAMQISRSSHTLSAEAAIQPLTRGQVHL